MFCPQGGTQLPEGASSCSSCGRQIRPVQAITVSPAVSNLLATFFHDPATACRQLRDTRSYIVGGILVLAKSVFWAGALSSILSSILHNTTGFIGYLMDMAGVNVFRASFGRLFLISLFTFLLAWGIYYFLPRAGLRKIEPVDAFNTAAAPNFYSGVTAIAFYLAFNLTPLLGLSILFGGIALTAAVSVISLREMTGLPEARVLLFTTVNAAAVIILVLLVLKQAAGVV